MKLNVGNSTAVYLGTSDVEQRVGDAVLAGGGRGLAVCDSVKTLGVELAFGDHVTLSIQWAVGRLRGYYRLRGFTI